MAKAKQVPAVSSATDLYEWAGAVLLLRFDEVISFAWAVRVPWNIKAVHDMRVALGRLRSALRDFVQVIDEKPLKRVKNDLKKIADLLGAVRDRDVAMIALEELAADAPDDAIKDGVAELIEDLRKERKRAHSRLLKAFESISLDRLFQRFSDRIVDSLRQQELFSPGTLDEVGRTVIEARLQEFREKGFTLDDPSDDVHLHDLRIAAKRLRYAIELFGICWGEEIAAFASELSKFQSLLGEVHDCDVWTVTLTKHIKENGKAKNENSKKAAVWLIYQFEGIRSKEYREALDLWRDWETTGFGDRLRNVLASSEPLTK